MSRKPIKAFKPRRLVSAAWIIRRSNYGISRSLSTVFWKPRQTEKREFQVLGKAHLKLAIAYTKKDWWEYALSEAKKSFDITPNKDCHDLIVLIEEKLSKKNY